jgi:O-antigen/teichoic acid export membrane protein
VNLYLAKAADFGIESMGAQEIARAGGELSTHSRFVSAVIGVRLLLTLGLIGLAVLVVHFAVSSPQREVLTLYFLLLVPIAASTKWVHIGRQEARPIGLTRIFGEVLALSIVALVVRGVGDVWLVPVAQLAGDSSVVLMLSALLVRAGLRLRPRLDFAAAWPTFRRAMPLTAQSVLGLVIYNSDIMFLRALRDSASVGYYASAYTLISFLANLGVAHGTSLLPALAKLHQDPAAERALFQGALARTFAVAFPVVVGGSLVAAGVIELAFGKAYAPAAPVLQVLMWSVLASTARGVCGPALIARGSQKLLLYSNIYGVVLNLSANTLLITRYGMYGAAIATVLTEFFGFLWVALRYIPREGLGGLPLARFAKPFVSGLAMAAVVVLLNGQHVIVRVVAGGAVYAGCMLALGAIRLRKGALPSLEV